MKRKIFLLEYYWVHLSYYHEEDSEEDNILPPLLHPLPDPQLDDHSLPHSALQLCNLYYSLFCNMLTPPLCDLCYGSVLPKVGQVTYIYPRLEEGVLKDVRR